MKKTVLLVDDEPEILDLLEMIFESLDFNCIKIDNGKEAIESIKNNDLDLLILDNIMPGMTGEETLEAIYKENLKNFKIIFSSGQPVNLEELSKDHPHFGDVDYLLNKPFNRDKVQEALDKIL